MQLFLELLQVSLGTRDYLSREPSESEWGRIFELAEIQTIAGILIDGIELLPSNQRPPTDLLLEWIGITQIIENQYHVHKAVAQKTYDCLRAGHIDVAFMKGLVCGARYPHPEHRQSGDIDFVVADKDFPKALDKLEEIGTVDREMVHEHHGMVYVGDVNLEPHYKVHNYQNPKVDKAMRDIFDGVFPQSLVEVKVGELMLPAFPPAFECALLVGHMVNHVYAEGLGMRQVVDFMIFLQKEHDTIKTDDCRRYLKMMRMERAFRIFACLCEDALGMSHELLGLRYSFKEKKFANKLLADILKVGNFGRGADYLGQNRFLVPIKSYFWVFGRCVTLGYLCPAEARWWPVSKFVRYFRGKILKKR